MPHTTTGEHMKRPGKTYKGHTVPYGTFVGASPELKQAYYMYGYLRDEDIPELPCPPQEDEECVDPEEELSKKDVARLIKEVLDDSTPREKKVLCLRFGIGVTHDHTLEEIGLVFAVTRERVRQIEAKAIRRIKNPLRLNKLEELVGQYVTTAEKKAKGESKRTQWEKERARAEEQARAEERGRNHMLKEILDIHTTRRRTLEMPHMQCAN